MEYKIGFVLSGGGARGITHLGVLKALEEIGIKPSVISGTSAGAIAAAFYAAGHSPVEILDIIRKGHFFSFSNIRIKKKGFFSMKGFVDVYKQYFPLNSFKSLNIPIHVAATDILIGKPAYFSEGDLIKSLLASSCIPVIFEPVDYQETLFLDGGILDNFPVKPLLNKCKTIIGVNVNSLKKETKNIDFNNLLDRSFHLTLSNSVREKTHLCQVFIEPPNMSQFNIFDLKKATELFDYGYTYTLSMKEQIKKAIES